MLKRLTWFVVALPAALVMVALAVANREPVRLVLDPFRPEAPVISLSLPLYAYLFGALILGVLMGGAAAWMGQSRWRRTARVKSQDAMRWQAEADRLTRERDSNLQASKKLAFTSQK